MFKGEADLNPSEFFLRPPRAGFRGHIYRLLQGPSHLRHRSGAFSVRLVKFWNRFPAHLVLSPSVSIFKKTVGPSMVRSLPCSTCVTSVPIHWKFSQYCYPRLFMFSLNPQSQTRLCGYYWPSWPFLPFINKCKYKPVVSFVSVK